MAKFEVVFPESFTQQMVNEILRRWQVTLPGHTFEANRSSQYTVVEILAYANVQFNPGFLSSLSSPIEQALTHSDFTMNLTTNTAEHSYAHGDWQ